MTFKTHISRLLWLFVIGLSLLVPCREVSAQRALPVFPGAEGFGTTTPAGSGRHLVTPHTTVIRVTSLKDSGPGTLRECVKQAFPRVCVFETSGRIELDTDLLIDKPYITIAGQTAPSPGILVSRGGVRVSTHDVLIQHLQLRVGDSKIGPKPENRDTLTVAGKSGLVAKNVVLDHLSISWGVDENFDVWYSSTSDVTLSRSIVSEGLYRSIHPKGAHGFGVLIGDGVKRVTLHRNVLAHNYDRNPRLKPGSQSEFVSNVVYDWGGTSSWNQANLADSDRTGIATQLAFIGNFYKRGKSSPSGGSLYAKPPAPASRAYALSNLGPTRTSESQSEWKIATFPEVPYRSLTPPFALSGVTPSSAIDSYQEVLVSAGSRPRDPNPVDLRVISEVTTGTGTIKDCVQGCSRSAGGYPTMNVVARPLVLPVEPDLDDDGDGYTNLEEWLFAYSAALE